MTALNALALVLAQPPLPDGRCCLDLGPDVRGADELSPGMADAEVACWVTVARLGGRRVVLSTDAGWQAMLAAPRSVWPAAWRGEG